MRSHRLASTALLAGGVVLVFAGFVSAFGLSSAGIVAAVAAITALLYTGGVWFGDSRVDPSIVLFTRELTIAGGPLAGRRVVDVFAVSAREEIESRCRQALDGLGSRFSCGSGAARQTFEAVPVRAADGAVAYGLLLSGALASAPASGQA
jgi:hypothetical protein